MIEARPWLFFLLRCVIAFGLIYLIFHQFEPENLTNLMASANLRWLIPAFVAQLTSSLVAAIRWQMLMRPLGFDAGTSFYQASYLKAILFNQGLPSSIGGDAMRVLDVVRLGYRKRESIAAILLDRVFGVSGLLLLALAAANLMPHAFSARFVLVVNLICGGALLAIVVLAVGGALPWLRNLPLRRIALLEPAWIVSDYLRGVLLAPGRLIRQLLLALITHTGVVLAFIAIGEALGMQIGLAVYFAFVPPLMLFALIPLSLAGWGLRETGAVTMLALVGVPAAESFAMSVSYGLILIATAAPGLVIYLAQGAVNRKPGKKN